MTIPKLFIGILAILVEIWAFAFAGWAVAVAYPDIDWWQFPYILTATTTIVLTGFWTAQDL